MNNLKFLSLLTDCEIMMLIDSISCRKGVSFDFQRDKNRIGLSYLDEDLDESFITINDNEIYDEGSLTTRNQNNNILFKSELTRFLAEKDVLNGTNYAEEHNKSYIPYWENKKAKIMKCAQKQCETAELLIKRAKITQEDLDIEHSY